MSAGLAASAGGGLTVSESVREDRRAAWESRSRVNSLLTRDWTLSSTSWARVESVWKKTVSMS